MRVCVRVHEHCARGFCCNACSACDARSNDGGVSAAAAGCCCSAKNRGNNSGALRACIFFLHEHAMMYVYMFHACICACVYALKCLVLCLRARCTHARASAVQVHAQAHQVARNTIQETENMISPRGDCAVYSRICVACASR